MFRIEELVSVVVYLIVLGLIAGILYWLIDFCGTSEPFRKVARIVLAVFCILVVISLLLGLAGHPVLVR